MITEAALKLDKVPKTNEKKQPSVKIVFPRNKNIF